MLAQQYRQRMGQQPGRQPLGAIQRGQQNQRGVGGAWGVGADGGLVRGDGATVAAAIVMGNTATVQGCNGGSGIWAKGTGSLNSPSAGRLARVAATMPRMSCRRRPWGWRGSLPKKSSQWPRIASRGCRRLSSTCG